jgi:hypothetical protein
LDRVLADVDQRHVVAIERLVVAMSERGPLAGQWIRLRAEELRRDGVLDGFPDLSPDELRRGFVRAFIHQDIVERLEDVAEAAALPGGLEDPFALLGGHVGGDAVRGDHREGEEVLLRQRPDVRVVLLDRPPPGVVQGVVASGNDVVGRSLEDRQVSGRLGDDRRRSRARRR